MSVTTLANRAPVPNNDDPFSQGAQRIKDLGAWADPLMTAGTNFLNPGINLPASTTTVIGWTGGVAMSNCQVTGSGVRVLSTGWYLACLQAGLSNVASGFVIAQLLNNGAVINMPGGTGNLQARVPLNAASEVAVALSVPVFLTANDILGVQFNNQSASVVQLRNPGAVLSVQRHGARIVSP